MRTKMKGNFTLNTMNFKWYYNYVAKHSFSMSVFSSLNVQSTSWTDWCSVANLFPANIYSLQGGNVNSLTSITMPRNRAVSVSSRGEDSMWSLGWKCVNVCALHGSCFYSIIRPTLHNNLKSTIRTWRGGGLFYLSLHLKRAGLLSRKSNLKK